MRKLGIRAISRMAAFTAAAAAVLATAAHLRHEPGRPRAFGAAGAAIPNGALARELDRCRGLGMAAKDDPGCEAAWAENRRRFFAPLSDRPSVAAANDTEPNPEAR